MRIPKLQWTWLTGGVACLGTWGALLLATASGRICAPVLSQRCVAHAWDFIGDLVWLRSLHEWETLATGALAIIAALIGGWFINKQIKQTEDHEKERWRRAMAAARSGLPHALNELSRHLERLAQMLRELLAHCQGGALPAGVQVPEFPLAPIDAEAAITRMVETSDENLGLLFSDVRNMLQIVNARLEMLRDAKRPSGRSANAIEDRIVDVIELHAHCMGLFPFARPDTKEQPTRAACSMLISSMRPCGFQQENFPALYQKATARMLKKLEETKKT